MRVKKKVSRSGIEPLLKLSTLYLLSYNELNWRIQFSQNYWQSCSGKNKGEGLCYDQKAYLYLESILYNCICKTQAIRSFLKKKKKSRNYIVYNYVYILHCLLIMASNLLIYKQINRIKELQVNAGLTLLIILC